ncbi:MAG: type III-B CRISPR module RAMP protein Cmr4 [Chloroflexi bacterium]|nr:MAG: type III-B CRISPR module RAMP protein Cmr4 [Chloroflexota bacterium]RLC85758.1 MAG: type III-B CRISPR module RAMP protein Cmr4 [Chloroflexota bacterium]
MFEAKTMLYVYVETPLHAGSGRALGAVDLPIQRERVTGYPIVQASSLKGRLRAEARARNLANLEIVFGPETDRASDHAGALSTGDAKILLFPVRSLAGVFAWTTSVEVLSRFLRDAAMVGVQPGWTFTTKPASGQVWVSGNVLQAGNKVVLEEFTFAPQQEAIVQTIGQWLAQNALPQATEYQYWRDELPKRLVILPNDDFRDFVTFSTEVVTRIKLNPETKTVEEGALWTEENLPTDTLLYAPLLSTPSRAPKGPQLTGQQVLDEIKNLKLTRIQLGGNETIGRGSVYLQFT